MLAYGDCIPGGDRYFDKFLSLRRFSTSISGTPTPDKGFSAFTGSVFSSVQLASIKRSLLVLIPLVFLCKLYNVNKCYLSSVSVHYCPYLCWDSGTGRKWCCSFPVEAGKNHLLLQGTLT